MVNEEMEEASKNIYKVGRCAVTVYRISARFDNQGVDTALLPYI